MGRCRIHEQGAIVNKAQLVNVVAETAGITKRAATLAINTVLEEVRKEPAKWAPTKQGSEERFTAPKRSARASTPTATKDSTTKQLVVRKRKS
jgi:nucleoid DNA-binding protein